MKAGIDTTDFFTANHLRNRKFSKTIHSNPMIIYISTNASWDSISCQAGFGFIISTNHKKILLARASGDLNISLIETELCAIQLSLDYCRNNNWNLKKLLSDCLTAIHLIRDFNNSVGWRHATTIQNIQATMLFWLDLIIDHINRENNLIADRLAHFGSLNHQLSLYSQERDHPIWLEDTCRESSLSF